MYRVCGPRSAVPPQHRTMTKRIHFDAPEGSDRETLWIDMQDALYKHLVNGVMSGEYDSGPEAINGYLGGATVVEVEDN